MAAQPVTGGDTESPCLETSELSPTAGVHRRYGAKVMPDRPEEAEP